MIYPFLPFLANILAPSALDNTGSSAGGPLSSVPLTSFGTSATSVKLSNFQFVGGYNQIYTKSQDNVYYNFTYSKQKLISSGTPATPTSVGQAFSPGSEPISLSVASGATNLGGTDLQSLGLQPLKQYFPQLHDFNLTAGVSGESGGNDDTVYRVGLETLPFHPFELYKPFQKMHLEDFIAPGIQYEHTVIPGSTPTDVGIVTARARLGKGFQYVVADATAQAFKKVLSDVKDLTVADAQKKIDAAKQKFASSLTTDYIINAMSQYKVELAKHPGLDDAGKDKLFSDTIVSVLQNSNGIITVAADQWSYSAFIEADADEAFTSQTVGSRYRSMYAGEFKILFNPHDTKAGYFDVRYENGFSVAAPTKRSNQLIVSIGKQF